MQVVHMNPQTVEREVELHPAQNEFCESPALYRGFVGGRGSGKSWAGAFDLLCRAREKRTYLVGSPTGILLQDTTYPTFKALAQSLGLWGVVKLTPYPNVTLTTGETIRFRTAEDPERMRGPNLSGIWLDEASLMPEAAYTVCIASLREAGEQGWLSATFTPKGPTHWTHEVFNTSRPDTRIFHASTGENPFNPPDFEATLFRQYGNTEFARQELGGKFVSMEGTTFPPSWLEWDRLKFHDWPDGILRRVLYLDPSQGKDAKSGDAQAFVLAGFWPGPGSENLLYLDAWANHEHPPAMVERGVRLCREYRPDSWEYETNGTLGLLEAEVDRQLREAQLLVRTWPVNHGAGEPKEWRVRAAFMPYLAQGRVRIRDTPGGRLLRAQLADWPWSERKDAADAGAGAITGLERLVNGGG